MEESKLCKECNEWIRNCNFERHEKRCLQGKLIRKRKSGYCVKCDYYYKDIKGHERKGCGKRKCMRNYRECPKCKRKFSVSNYERHIKVCGNKHVIRRKKNSKKEKRGEVKERD